MVHRVSDHMHENQIDSLEQGEFPRIDAEIGAEEAKPRTKAEIIALLKADGDKFASTSKACRNRFWPSRSAMMPGAQPADQEPLRDADVGRRNMKCITAVS